MTGIRGQHHRNLQVGTQYNVYQGIVTGNNEAYIFDDISKAYDLHIEPELLHKMCHGRDIDRWYIYNRNRKILYVNSNIEIENYPNAKKWLEGFKGALSERRECTNGVIPWYSLQWPREKDGFLRSPKIMIQNTRNERLQPRIVACMDEDGFFGTQGLNFIIPIEDADPYHLLGILNSKLINYVFSTKFLNLAIKAEYLKKLRIPKDNSNTNIAQIARELVSKSERLHELSTTFVRYVSRNYQLDNISKRLEEWFKYPFNELLKELKKSKAELPYTEQTELEKIFSVEREKCIQINIRVLTLEKELNNEVYKLYNIDKTEIELVEAFK